MNPRDEVAEVLARLERTAGTRGLADHEIDPETHRALARLRRLTPGWNRFRESFARKGYGVVHAAVVSARLALGSPSSKVATAAVAATDRTLHGVPMPIAPERIDDTARGVPAPRSRGARTVTAAVPAAPTLSEMGALIAQKRRIPLSEAMVIADEIARKNRAAKKMKVPR